MAESIGSLFLRIGISLNELQSDFIAAEKTISQNMARLSREQQIIKLRAQIDIAGLDPKNDAAKILEVQMKSLNQQIASQKDRLKLAEVGLQETTQRTGELSVETQKATIAFEREKLALKNLENELQNLSAQKIQLNTDNLTSQFTNAQRIIEAQIASLNQKNAIIKMRAEFDMTGLDREKNAAKILETQTKSLNQQIKNQQAILKMTEAVMRETATRTGQFSTETLKATANVERERLALKHLEEELRNVTNEQKQLTDQQAAANKNPLLSGYQNIKSEIASHINNITSAFNGLQAASQSADGAITKSLEIIGSIPHPAGRAVAAIASIPLVLRGVENSILSYTKAAIAAGDSVYVMSRGMQLSVAEMGKLSTVAKVTGIDINEVNSNLRRIETQFVKSGSSGNSMTKMLDKYNVKLTDANGNLKKGIELSLALADGLKKAQVEGKGAEFISAVGGKFWSADFITYLEDLTDNLEVAGKVVKNGLADPALAHQVQGNLNTMDAQAAQLKASFASAFIPVANEIVPRITERMGELTKFIADNKDEIKEFGNAIARFFGKIEDGADMAFKAVKILHDGLKELKINPEQKELEIKYSFNLNPKDNFDVYKQVQESYNLSNPTYFAPMLKKLDDAKEKTDKFTESLKKANEELEKLKQVKIEAPKIIGGGGISAQIERNSEKFDENLAAAREENKKIRELDDELYHLTHNDYENQKYDVLSWQQERLNDENATEDERAKIKEVSNAKLEKIERDHQKKISEIREENASKIRTDLENQIAAIEKNQERQIAAGLPRIEAEKAAEQAKYEVLKRLEEDWAATRDSIGQTDLAKTLARIDKEVQAWRQKGADGVEVADWAAKAKAEATEKLEKDFAAAREALYQDDLEKELARIDAAKEAWIQKGIDEVEATEWAEEAKAQAMEKNARKEEQDARQRAQRQKQEVEAAKRAAIEKANAQRNAALQVLKSELEDYRLYQEKGIQGLIEKNKQELYKSEITDKDLQMTPQMLNDFKKAQDKAMQSLLPNFKQTPYKAPWDNYSKPRREEPPEPYEPRRRPTSSNKPNDNENPQIEEPTQAASQGLVDVANAGSAAAEALYKIGNVNPNPQNEQPTPQYEPTQPSQSNWRQPIDNPYEINGYAANQDWSKKMYTMRDPNNPDNHAYVTPEQIRREIENGRKFNIDPSVEAGAAASGHLKDFLEPFQNLGDKAKDAANNLSDLAPEINNFKNDLPEITKPEAPEMNTPNNTGINEAISNVSSKIQSAQSIIQEATQKFNDATSQLSQLTESITSLQQSINHLPQQNPQAPNVTNNFNTNINEPHAWNGALIRELADKVAGILGPEVKRALGGDRNSY